MANVETIRDEYTFLVQAGATYEHIFYERRLGLQVYYYFVERSGRAVAHDEERRAFERLGKRTASGPNGYLGSSQILSFQGRVGNVARSGARPRPGGRRPSPRLSLSSKIIYSPGPESCVYTSQYSSTAICRSRRRSPERLIPMRNGTIGYQWCERAVNVLGRLPRNLW